VTCAHHWTVTSECPQCLRAQLDDLTVRYRVCKLDADGQRKRVERAEAERTATAKLLTQCQEKIIPQLRAERDALRNINFSLGESKNQLLIDGARLQERAERAEAERDLAASTFTYQSKKIERLQEEVAALRALLARLRGTCGHAMSLWELAQIDPALREGK